MKRALAERVKQERKLSPLDSLSAVTHHHHDALLIDGVPLSSSSHPLSSVPSHPPPQSIEPNTRPRSPNTHSSGNLSSFQNIQDPDHDRPRPRKRYARDYEEEETDPTTGEFYLKMQNSALAGELYAYRRRIYLLEREREWRRRECGAAAERVRFLGGIWRTMEEGLLKKVADNGGTPSGDSKEYHIPPPVSTGSGTDVETIPSLLSALNGLMSRCNAPGSMETQEALHNPGSRHHLQHVDSINNFESYSKINVQEEDDDDLIIQKQLLTETNEFVVSVSSRVKQLHGGIMRLFSTENNLNAPLSESVSDLQEQILRLESDLKDADEKLEEVAKARNEAVASERRVRRGLYRLASGRMTLEDVLKAVEKEDNGVSFLETIAMIDGLNQKNAPLPDGTSGTVSSSDVMSSPSFSAMMGNSKDSSGFSNNSEELNLLKKTLQDVQAIADAREEQIADLLNKKEEHLKLINSLLFPKDDGASGLDDEAISKSPAFIELLAQLGSAKRMVQELELQLEATRQRWAVTKGDFELAKKTIIEMEGKHERRWHELISQFPESDSRPSSDIMEEAAYSFCSAKRIAELESKLQQSVEAVNRTETLRATLSDAYKMNEALQSKLDDLKNKNAKMIAEKSAARAAQGSEPLASPQAASYSKQQNISGANSIGDPSIEKLQRDCKRARKEVAAAVMSKDQAKLKQERAEKERDALMKTNARLLKQSSEKDDMNAKSLSTILHLKQRNDELEKENSIIKQKAQATHQLSLAARLASNAKERVGEEALKEKEIMEESIKKLQAECSTLRNEMDQTNGLLTLSNEKVASVTKDLEAARGRCDDFVTESTKKDEEKKHMMESLAVVKKEAMEAAKKSIVVSGGASTNDGVRSDFTTEQLTTQVKYLSDRMTCPVCNTREKKCILLRCRHMFCQKCVDENIKNRSRKCPACAQRFDTKDVAEIWL